MRRRCALVALVAVVVLFGTAACSRGDDAPAVRLDGSPRVPDAEGVVREVDRAHLTLEDGRTFALDPDLQSFASSTGGALAVRQRKGEYVQLGLDDDTAVWVASIGAVVPLTRPVVFYFGTIDHLDDRSLVFEDGTVLRARRGLRVVEHVPVRVELDVATKEVTALAAS